MVRTSFSIDANDERRLIWLRSFLPADVAPNGWSLWVVVAFTERWRRLAAWKV
jgi:hypothetical protein